MAKLKQLPLGESMVPFVLRVPENLRRQIEDLAEIEKRTVSAMARLLLDHGVRGRTAKVTTANKQDFKRLILEGRKGRGRAFEIGYDEGFREGRSGAGRRTK